MSLITSQFGKRTAPLPGGSHEHDGVDYKAPIGSPIYANKELTVTYAGPAKGYGTAVYAIDNVGTQYRFGHLDSIPSTTVVGAKIQLGEEIAKSGNSGVSTGAHLHYEVRINGKAVDPLTTIDPSTGKPYEYNVSFESKNGTSLSNSIPKKAPGYTPNGVDNGTQVAALDAGNRRNAAADQRVTGTNTAPDLKGEQAVFNRPGIKTLRINPLLQFGDQ